MFDFTNPISSTVPNSEISSNLNKLCELEPGKFDALTKLLSLLQEFGPITINAGVIIQKIDKGTAVLHTSISKLIGQNINLTILNPKKYIKLFKSIKGNNNVIVYDDPAYQRYIISNGDIKLFLPKQLEDLSLTMADLPDFSKATILGSPIKIDANYKNNIKSLIGSEDHVDLLFEGTQLKAMYIPDTAVYTFSSFVGKTTIDENNADLMLKSYTFAIVDGEEYTFNIGKLEDEDYWMVTQINTGLVDVTLFEKTAPASNDNLLV
jgi:hypothetical protein